MRRLLAFAFALTALSTPAGAAATSPLSVRTALEAPAVGVGDAFGYVVEVQVVGGGLSPRDVKVVADTGSFAVIGPARIDRSSTRLRLTQTLACLDPECAPLDGVRRVALPAPRASAPGVSATAPPALVRIKPRVPAAAVRAPRAMYRRDTSLPDPTSPVSAGWAGAFAVLLASLLLLGSAASVFLEWRRSAPGPGSVEGRLVRALRLLRESSTRSDSDRRRAADLLSRALVSRGADPLADDATRVAWSARRPAPPDAEALVAKVERALGDRS